MTHDKPEPTAVDAAALADRYLQLCEDRDLEAARRLLAPDAVLVFPGGRVMTSLSELVELAAGQYRWVRKRRDHAATSVLDDGRVQVLSRGRLYGENLRGAPFENVRYIDLFVLRDGLIAEQHVWNDLAVTGVLDRRTP